jgi:hypothetical protein
MLNRGLAAREAPRKMGVYATYNGFLQIKRDLMSGDEWTGLPQKSVHSALWDSLTRPPTLNFDTVDHGSNHTIGISCVVQVDLVMRVGRRTLRQQPHRIHRGSVRREWSSEIRNRCL